MRGLEFDLLKNGEISSFCRLTRSHWLAIVLEEARTEELIVETEAVVLTFHRALKMTDQRDCNKKRSEMCRLQIRLEWEKCDERKLISKKVITQTKRLIYRWVRNTSPDSQWFLRLSEHRSSSVCSGSVFLLCLFSVVGWYVSWCLSSIYQFSRFSNRWKLENSSILPHFGWRSG